MLYIGIDLGTSNVKLLLTDERGTILRIASREYPLYFPRTGWSEQNAADWWDAVVDGMHELTQGIDCSQVAASQKSWPARRKSDRCPALLGAAGCRNIVAGSGADEL